MIEHAPATIERHALEGKNKTLTRHAVDGASKVKKHPSLYPINGKLYPLRRAKRCKTCNIKDVNLRGMIEGQILAGINKEAIARQLPESLGITGANLNDHANAGHMPLTVDVQHKLMVEAHEEAGDPTNPYLVTDIGLAKIVIHKVFAKLQAGDYDETLTLADGLACARFVRDVQRMGGMDDITEEILIEKYRLIWDTIEEAGGKEVAEKVHQFMTADPILAKIKPKAFPLMKEGDVDGESFEDFEDFEDLSET